MYLLSRLELLLGPAGQWAVGACGLGGHCEAGGHLLQEECGVKVREAIVAVGNPLRQARGLGGQDELGALAGGTTHILCHTSRINQEF